jgi:hypothetical protein
MDNKNLTTRRVVQNHENENVPSSDFGSYAMSFTNSYIKLGATDKSKTLAANTPNQPQK